MGGRRKPHPGRGRRTLGIGVALSRPGEELPGAAEEQNSQAREHTWQDRWLQGQGSCCLFSCGTEGEEGRVAPLGPTCHLPTPTRGTGPCPPPYPTHRLQVDFSPACSSSWRDPKKPAG